jgi:hypothetical protein
MASSSTFDDYSNQVEVTIEDLFNQLSFLWNVKPKGRKKESKKQKLSKSTTICLRVSGEEPVVLNTDPCDIDNNDFTTIITPIKLYDISLIPEKPKEILIKRPSKKRQSKEEGKQKKTKEEVVQEDVKEVVRV